MYTKEEAIKKFREHWKWISETGLKKCDYPKFEEYIPDTDCYLCDFLHRIDPEKTCDDFHGCLISWDKNGGGFCMDEGALYKKWIREWDIDTKKKIALKISKLPINKNIKVE